MPSTVTNRLQGLTTSVAVKPPCVAVTTANITLSGLQTINGTTVAEDDRVLVKDQSTASENGIYLASTGSWTRAKDFDGELDAVQGTLVLVRNGVADGAIYELTTANPITIGTTSLTFELRDDPAITYAQTDAEIAAGVTPSNYSYPPGHFVRYGADPTGTNDSTTAINAAVSCSRDATFVGGQPAYCEGGDFRVDGTITIGDYQACYLNNGRLIRKSSGSASTAPVLHVKGTQAVFDGGGGSIWTENNSPDGLVVCGHLNRTTSNWNSLWWRFCNTWVYTKDFGGSGASPYPAIGDGIGVYVPSSQPQLGANYTNYFGTIENVVVHNATTAFWLTDLANGHVLHNCSFRGLYHSGFVLNGAYGNTIIPGFCEIPYKNGVIVLHLNTKLSPAAPFASSLESSRNTIHRLPVELSGTGQTGIRCESTCQYNRGSISFNATGTALVDLDGANDFDSDTDRSTNRNITTTGLLTVSRTVSATAVINSTHANGPAMNFTRSGSAVGQIGASAAGGGGGTNLDMEVTSASTKNLYLVATGGGRIIFAAGGLYSIVSVPAYADDAAAAAGGVPVGGIYRTASALKVRVS